MSGDSTQIIPLLRWLRGSATRRRRRPVPVLLQLSAVECGAACLAMILSYYGRQTRVAECRDLCAIGRDGTTALTLAKVARQHGLRVKAYSLEPAAFTHVPLPAIVHWDFNHFVVVEHWTPHRVEIVDPAVGRCRLSAAEFDAHFTGVTLTFEPGVQFASRRSAQPTSWRSYLTHLIQIPGIAGVMIQILVVSVLLQALGLAVPALTKALVDTILPFRITGVMSMLGIGIIFLVLAQLVIGYLRAALLLYVQIRLDSRLMLGFFEHLLTLPFQFFQQRTSGDLLMRLGSNALIRETLTSQTLSIVLDSSLALVYLAILLAQAPSFGLLVLAIGLLQIATLLGTTPWMHRLMQRDLYAAAESQSYLVEALTGIAALKAAGVEERALDHWSNLFWNHLNIAVRRNHLAAIIDTVMSTLRTLAPLLLLWFGALRVLDGTLTLGTMLALNTLAIAVLTPLASLVSTGRQLQLVGAHLERIADVIQAEPEQNLEAVQLAPRLTGRIDVRNVQFQYNPSSPPVLRDISVTIEPGQKVALVGRTGSGKTTLAMLLIGLYPPTAGEILYDGLPLQRLNYRSLRNQFGVVLQDSFIFSGSIRQNIAFNDPGLDLEGVIVAARCAAIHDEIMAMPMRYETLVTESGTGLSGGQRQRLAIARALAHHPAVLVLDEATSHLDVLTETQVDRYLSALRCTRIVVAHRLSTICNADLILVLDQGTIVEHGTHAELLARGGFYATLVHGQQTGAATTHADAP
ncbi:MAG TPA: peptidase domain-containing ABC transporter [Herpetosiphonaceae bacterium]